MIARSLATIAIAACVTAGIPEQAVSENGRLGVELNKFEAGETGGCRTFFLFRNEAGMTLEAFEMSLAILDSDGVIDQLLSINAAPLPIARTTLKLFEIPDISCESVSEILLHEMTACTPQNAEPIDCFEIMDLSSKASAVFVK